MRFLASLLSSLILSPLLAAPPVRAQVPTTGAGLGTTGFPPCARRFVVPISTDTSDGIQVTGGQCCQCTSGGIDLMGFNVMAGFRFRDVPFYPQQEEVTSMVLSFRAMSSNSGAAALSIHLNTVQRVRSPCDPLASNSLYLTTLNVTAPVVWQPPAFAANSLYRSGELLPVFQEYWAKVGGEFRPGVTDLLFVINGTGDRKVKSFEDSPSQTALLTVDVVCRDLTTGTTGTTADASATTGQTGTQTTDSPTSTGVPTTTGIRTAPVTAGNPAVPSTAGSLLSDLC
jgi:hypothetical protein